MCTSTEWRKAQCIMDNICSLCNYNKPAVPRACRLCDRFGHSSKFCPKKAEAEAFWAQEQNDKWLRENPPITQSECTPAQWKQVCRLRAINAAVEAALASGLGPSTCGSCGQCQACVSWREFIQWHTTADHSSTATDAS